MKKLVMVLLAVLVLVFSGSVFAADWIYHGIVNGNKFYVDTDSFEKMGKSLSYCHMIEIKDLNISYITKVLINCESREQKATNVWMYISEEDSTINMGPTGNGWKKISKETIHDEIAKRFCK